MDDCGDGFIDTDGLCPTGADMRGSDRLSLTVSRTIWRFAVEADVPFFFPGILRAGDDGRFALATP